MSIPNDAEIAGLMAKLYDPKPGDFDHIEDPGTDDGVCWAIKHCDGLDVLIFRGSMTKEDWFRDVLAALPAPPSFAAQTASLGMLPLGFNEGMYGVMRDIDVYRLSRSELVIGGHSLGAARACIAAGLHLISGGKVRRIVLCGCPRSGTMVLANLLGEVPIASYRNRGDPVCDLPTDPPWSHVAGFKMLDEAPAPGDISIFRDHHIALYVAGIAKLRG